jgi:phage gp36-like protein
MPYCTRQNLIDEFGEAELIALTDRQRLGILDDAVLDRAIVRADRTVNRWLGGRNSLPLGADDVADLACDIARYYLYEDHATETVRKRYEDAIAQLKAMAKGEMGVANSAGTMAPAASGAEMESGGRIFDRADNGFI